MKTIAIRNDGSIGSREYGRMLTLELEGRGVTVIEARDGKPSPLLMLCDVFNSEIAEDMGSFAEKNGLPVLVCARELEASLPMGVMGAERPLDVGRLCEALVAEDAEREKGIPEVFSVPAAKEGIVIDRVLRKVTCQGEPVGLTAREYDLLAYLDDHRGIALSREEIACAVWGLPTNQTNVVDVYIRYLRQKLDEPFDTRYILTVRGKGYMLKKE